MPADTAAACNGLRLLTEEPPMLERPEDRIGAALGVKGSRLPEVSNETLQDYYDYLIGHLSFPFPARYPEAVGLHDEILRTATVVTLFDPAKNLGGESLGLVCKARLGKREVELSLADLEVEADGPNHRLVEDYWYWFWNGQ
jgi:hypothetical protein